MACVYRVPHYVQSAVALAHSHAMFRDIHLSVMQVQMGSNQVVIWHRAGLATWIHLTVRKTLRPCSDIVSRVPGCVRKKTSDASKFFCVPAGVTGIPPLSFANITKFNSCDSDLTGPGCQATKAPYEEGTGCLDKCQADRTRTMGRLDTFCADLDVWTCPGTPAPCSGALPAGSAPVGAVNPFSAPSEAPGPNAGAVCGMLVV
jgi:hypothetical protein